MARHGTRTATILSVAAAALAGAMLIGLGQPIQTTQPAVNPVSPKTPEPVWTPQFVTGYEPDEVTVTGTGTIDWMVFDNTSTHADAAPWAMSVFYETPGTTADRWARLIDDPTEPGNTVLAYWLSNAVIDAGFQNHTKGRIQTGFPGDLVDAVEIYSRQRIYLTEDWNLLLAYPPDADQWWIGVAFYDYWMGAAWEGHPNPSLIGLSFVPYHGAMRLAAHHRTMPDLGTVWLESNLNYEVPVGAWFTMEIGYKMGDADTGRFVVVITPEDTGVASVVLDITDWTYDPAADLPGGTGPVAATKWNPQKLYSSDNVIHFIRDAGGVAQAYFDDFEFSGQWPPNWP
jgi:hypothetical protein